MHMLHMVGCFTKHIQNIILPGGCFRVLNIPMATNCKPSFSKRQLDYHNSNDNFSQNLLIKRSCIDFISSFWIGLQIAWPLVNPFTTI